VWSSWEDCIKVIPDLKNLLSEDSWLSHVVKWMREIADIVSDKLKDNEDGEISCLIEAECLDIMQAICAHCPVDTKILVIVGIASVELEEFLVETVDLRLIEFVSSCGTLHW